MLRQSFIYCTIGLLLVGCSSQGNKAPVASIKPSQSVVSHVHKVAKDESLHDIARKHGKDIHRLASLNNLHEPYALQPGQKLLLGSKSGSSSGGYKTKIASASPSKSKPMKRDSDMGFVKVTADKPIYNDLPTDTQYKPSKQELIAEVNKSEFSQYEVESKVATMTSMPASESASASMSESAPFVVKDKDSKVEPKLAEAKVIPGAAKELPLKADKAVVDAKAVKVANLNDKGTAKAGVATGTPVSTATGLSTNLALSDKHADKASDKKADIDKKSDKVEKLEKVAKTDKVEAVAEAKVDAKVEAKPEAKIAKAPEAEKAAPLNVASKSVKGWRWPHTGNLVVEGNQHFHRNGIDIKGNSGDMIKSVAEGKVVYKGNGLRGYGELVIIKHPNDYLTAYAHNEKVLVKEGDVVKAGDTIAYMGNTGSDSVKLHFEMRHKGKPVDPIQYLPPR